MKVIVTGSLGHIGKPLTEELVQKGHTVTVISSNPAKQKEIEDLGAVSAIGSLQNTDFLTDTFAGADIVYCMVPPNFAAASGMVAYYRSIGNSYAQAIRQSGVKRVIHLSSFGAQLESGTGIILGSHNVEEILNELPDIAVTHMRPTYFYYNLNSFIPMIKATGTMAANYGGEDSIVLVSPADIAAAIAEEIETPAVGREVRYVASDEHTGNDIAAVLGAAIGIPDLKWITISSAQMQQNMEANGMPSGLVADLVEMYDGHHRGILAEDYYRNRPAVMGKVKLADFVPEFAAAFK